MDVFSTSIPDVKLVVPERLADGRGWFAETYRADRLAAAGIEDVFVQENQSFSVLAGTIRGVHYQAPPAAQSKIVRVLSGAILDVAVDLRRASSTYGHHVAVRLDADEGRQLYMPAGFGHGFCTLEANTMVAYMVGGTYFSPAHERRLAFDDPDLAIGWPVTRDEAVLSEKDRKAPRLADIEALL